MAHHFCLDSWGAWLLAGVAPELHVLWGPYCVVARAGACGVLDEHSSGGRRYNHDPAPDHVPAGSGTGKLWG